MWERICSSKLVIDHRTWPITGHSTIHNFLSSNVDKLMAFRKINIMNPIVEIYPLFNLGCWVESSPYLLQEPYELFVSRKWHTIRIYAWPCVCRMSTVTQLMSLAVLTKVWRYSLWCYTVYIILYVIHIWILCFYAVRWISCNVPFWYGDNKNPYQFRVTFTQYYHWPLKRL